jgi:hypothetical protein
LRSLDLQPQHIRLQLQDLVFYLAVLQSRLRGTSYAFEGIIKATCCYFGFLANFSGGGDDGEVGSGYRGEVGCVDLRRVFRIVIAGDM